MITSVTSAGFIMFGIQIMLYAAKKIQLYVPNIFKIILYVTTISYVFLTMFSNRGPIMVFISFASLNPATAFARYQQWMFAADDINENPFFGIGFFEWSRPFWMSSSVDSFWLLSALQNGYPAIIALGAFIILTAIKHWQEWKKSNNNLFFVFFTIVFSIVFAGFTVDFFDRAQLFLFMLIGMFSSFISQSKNSRV
jgi:O-antigen ligase